jgi:hypothetical protein
VIGNAQISRNSTHKPRFSGSTVRGGDRGRRFANSLHRIQVIIAEILCVPLYRSNHGPPLTVD